MKKFTATFLAILFFVSAAQATGFYVGGDVLQSYSQHSLSDKNGSSGKGNVNRPNDNSSGYGVNAGFRLDVLNLLAFGEAFYDQIGTSATGFTSSNGAVADQNRIKINNRYGAKANFGFAILPRVTPFLGFGMANVDYDIRDNYSGQTVSKSELAPIYSVGLVVDLILGISVRASYDYQRLSLGYVTDSATVKTNLGTAKLGVMYSF